jgi:hypothetical protein
LREDSKIKESVFAISDYASAPSGETQEEAKARRDGRRFALAEARDGRTKARALVKQGINPAQHRQLERIKRAQENATTLEAVAKEWLALKDWGGGSPRSAGWTCSPEPCSPPLASCR